METFSALLAICAGNSPATGEFPAQRPVTWSLNGFFDHCNGYQHQHKLIAINDIGYLDLLVFQSPRSIFRVTVHSISNSCHPMEKYYNFYGQRNHVRNITNSGLSCVYADVLAPPLTTWHHQAHRFRSSNPVWVQDRHMHIDGLVQERRNSSALAVELRLSCTNPSAYGRGLCMVCVR